MPPRRDFRPKDKPAKAAGGGRSGGGRGSANRAGPSGPAQNGAGGRRPSSSHGQNQQQARPAKSSPAHSRTQGRAQSFSKQQQHAQARKVVFDASGKAAGSSKVSASKKGTEQEGDSEDESDPDEEAAANDSDQNSILGDDDMMVEIEALGGDRSDLELIKSVGKAGSAAPTAENDPKLELDLKAFIKQLNLPAVAPEEPEDIAQAEASEHTSDKKANKETDNGSSQASEKEVVKKKKKAKDEGDADQDGIKKEQADKMMFEDDGIIRPDPPAFKSYFQPADPSQLAHASGRPERDGLSAQVTPLWSQAVLPKLAAAPPPSEKMRRKAKAANQVGQHAALSDEHIASLEERASKLLERENAIYARMFEAEATGTANAKTSLAAAGSTISASDARFIRTLLSTSGEGGTVSDRISALTLLLQSSPLHNLRPLESLMAMVRKKNREESGRASRALSDWFASASGLPGDRKLRYFRDQPALADVAFALSDDKASKAKIAEAEKHLLFFAFEHRLKTTFFDFLLLLEARSHDTLAFARTSAVVQTSNLLSAKPEQEQNLLRLLVNKLGDGERSVASKASNALLQLLNDHPFMKTIVAREVADLILKPATHLPASGSQAQSSNGKSGAADIKKYNSHARYYGVLTLNQTMITSKDRESGLANALVNLYFELFEGILEDLDSGKRGGKGAPGREEKLGAGGEAEEAEDDDEDETDAKPKQKNRWRDQGGKRRKKGKQAASHGGKEIHAVVKDAEAKIVAALLTGVRRAMPFATLETTVFEKHIDTLFRITHSGTFNISIQALQLIFQVCTSVRGAGAGGENDEKKKAEGGFTSSAALRDRYYRALYASLIDQRLEETSKQAMYLNLLFRSMKIDALASAQGGEEQLERLKAFSKRLTQVLGHHQPPFICGALFMLGELCKLSDALRGMLIAPSEVRFPLRDGAEENQDEEEGDESVQKNGTQSYDGLKRDPRFAHAGSTCLWEVIPFLSHYHPSVALHAGQLLDGSVITANPDLNTSSLSHFLDRFVFRNPKAKAPAAKGASIMQPGSGLGTGDLTAGVGVDDVNVVNLKGRGVSKEEDVMNPKFWKKSRENVPVDQIFFHQYFQQKQAREKGAALGKGKDGNANEDDVDALLDQDEHQGESGADTDADEDEDAGGDGEVLDEDEYGEEEIWEAIMNALPEAGDVDKLEDSDDSDDDDDEDGSDAAEELDPEDFSDDEELDAMLGRGRGDVEDSDDDEDDDELDELLLQEDDSGSDDRPEEDEDDDDEDDSDDENEVAGEAGIGDDDEEEEDSEDDDDDSLDVELLEDDDDLLSFDGDSGFGEAAEDDEEDEADVPTPTLPAPSKRKDKRKRGRDDEDEQGVPAAKLSNKERREQRKKLKAMPAFASAEDYAHLLDSDDEGN
ncbi:RNA-binding ribosome biosynthesis protein mak21 [Tilletia horrida]|nr:RNA-binding ribosome biosynthesis protein mak21 [Tilletia horrida]